jgi:hypothetical protein
MTPARVIGAAFSTARRPPARRTAYGAVPSILFLHPIPIMVRPPAKACSTQPVADPVGHLGQ